MAKNTTRLFVACPAEKRLKEDMARVQKSLGGGIGLFMLNPEKAKLTVVPSWNADDVEREEDLLFSLDGTLRSLSVTFDQARAYFRTNGKNEKELRIALEAVMTDEVKDFINDVRMSFKRARMEQDERLIMDVATVNRERHDEYVNFLQERNVKTVFYEMKLFSTDGNDGNRELEGIYLLK